MYLTTVCTLDRQNSVRGGRSDPPCCSSSSDSLKRPSGQKGFDGFLTFLLNDPGHFITVFFFCFVLYSVIWKLTRQQDERQILVIKKLVKMRLSAGSKSLDWFLSVYLVMC